MIGAALAPVLAALAADAEAGGAAGAGAPAGAQAFAIIIASGPADARERAARERGAAPAIASVSVAAGWPRTLDGRDVAELKSGYWAVAAGVCATRAEAAAVLERLRGERYPGAYLKPTRAPLPAACPALRPAWDRAERLAAPARSAGVRLLSGHAVANRAFGAERLVKAAEAGEGKRVRALLAAGADVNHVTGFGATALGTAAYAGHEAVVRLLLAAGGKPDLRGDGAQDETPLMMAAGSPATDAERVARLLIARGADVNATTTGAEADYGTSPLTEALAGCRPALVRLLIAKGARVVIDGSRRRCGTADNPAPPELRDLLARTKLNLR